MEIMLCTAVFLLGTAVVWGGHVPDHLVLPPFEPTWNLSKSTIIQACNVSGGVAPDLPQWGIVSYDWSTDAGRWHADHPNDCDVKLLDQAAAAKTVAPDTQIWIYRNLVQAYAEFSQVREKLEDPQYAGWFLKFGPHNDNTTTPKCSKNSRGVTLCSELFHWKGQRPNGDCGDIIPCGWYVFDHRNSSLRTWLIDEFLLGKRFGLGNESVSGFYFDDWWTLDGPTEVDGFFGGTNLPHYGKEIAEIYGNWSITMWEAQKQIAAAGGWSWNEANCNLDSNPGYGGAPVVMPPCSLTKTEGYPFADNVKGAPLKQHTLSAAKAQCTEWLSTACTNTSVIHKIPFILSYTRNDNGKQFPLPSPIQDIATFLLVRGKYAWMGYGWIGCTDSYSRPDALNHDYGEAVDEVCHQSSPGVFTRRYTKATVTLDCTKWEPHIVLDGESSPIPY
eukprot:Sspe_Gene.1601::Locus_531_Transcript_1_1_Confidence_1.000_Length_1868::g.1601::m.1601